MANFLSFDNQALTAALALAIGFPVLLLILNETIHHFEKRQIAITPTLRSLRNLVLPTLALALFVRYVAEIPQEQTGVRLVESAFWICLLIAVLTFLNDVIFGSAAKGSWRERVPTLFRDLARAVLVALGAAIIYSQVWDQEITGALTALGVGSVVLGLALQEPLGNIVSGLMLLFERPLNIGDWITADGVTGKVIEINWRSVHIETPTRELRIVPNVSLYKEAFSNLSRPTAIRTDTYEIGFSYDHPPNEVKQVLLEILKSTPGVLADPSPLVRTVNYADFSVIYRMIFSVRRQEDLAAVRDQVVSRIWYAARRSGLNIPFPIAMEYGPTENPAAPKPNPEELLKRFPRYRLARQALQEEGHKSTLGKALMIREFAANETIFHPKQKQAGFSLIINGNASLTTPDRAGNQVEISTLGPGEFFGEYTVTGSPEGEFSVTALTDVLVVHFEPEEATEMLARSPSLAAEVGEAIETRRRAAQQLRQFNKGG